MRFIQNGSSGCCRCISNVCEMEWKVYLLRHSSVETSAFGYVGFRTRQGPLLSSMKHMIDMIYFRIHAIQYSACISHLHPEFYLIPCCNVTTMARGEEKRLVSLHCSALTQSPMYVHHPVTSFHVGSNLSACIAHTSSWITETISVKDLLWRGTQQRG